MSFRNWRGFGFFTIQSEIARKAATLRRSPAPQSFSGFGTECLLLLARRGQNPGADRLHFVDGQTTAKLAMKIASTILLVASLLPAALPARGQSGVANPFPPPHGVDESGQLLVQGRATPYRIRRLPVSSFPELPATIAQQLSRRGCLIPQTYQAYGPENVIHASLERPGSADWAVLCSVQGTVSLLVFFASAPELAQVLTTAREVERLQAQNGVGELGFAWGIDPASPERVHQAQSGMEHRPALLDHDALADTFIDHRTVYRFYFKNAWTRLDVPE